MRFFRSAVWTEVIQDESSKLEMWPDCWTQAQILTRKVGEKGGCMYRKIGRDVKPAYLIS